MEAQSRRRSLTSRISDLLGSRESKAKEEVVDELDRSHRKQRNSFLISDESIHSKYTSKTDEEESSGSQVSDVGGGGGKDSDNNHVRAFETAITEAIAETMAKEEESSPSRATKEQKDEPHVRFSHVQVREYPICMGDNPGAYRGVPISMGWDAIATKTLPVDDFELRATRRHQLQHFRIDPLERVLMLKRVGYSGREIKEGTATVDEVRVSRLQTIKALRFASLYENLERVKRGVLNQTLWKSQKKQEREYLRRYKKANTMNFKVHNLHAIASRRLEDSIQVAPTPPEGAASRHSG